MIVPNTSKNKKCSKPPNSHHYITTISPFNPQLRYRRLLKPHSTAMFHLHSSWLAAVHPPRHWLHRAQRTAAATANADVGVRRPCLSQWCPKKWRSWWTSLGESTWMNYGLLVNISNYFMGFVNFELGEKKHHLAVARCLRNSWLTLDPFVAMAVGESNIIPLW